MAAAAAQTWSNAKGQSQAGVRLCVSQHHRRKGKRVGSDGCRPGSLAAQPQLPSPWGCRDETKIKGTILVPLPR